MSRIIRIVNHSKEVTATQLLQAVAALQTQVIRDFAPSWAASCSVQAAENAGPGQEAIHLLDGINAPGALGYHDVAGSDTPVGFVDVAASIAAGDHWSATLSHELLEQLVDPFCQGGYLATWQGRPALLAAETADPVENSEYQINGMWVSNFITPFWFVPPPLHLGARTDFLNVLAGKSLTLDRGGYVAWTADLVNWQQTFAKETPAHQMLPPAAHTRRARRLHRFLPAKPFTP